MTAEIDQPLTSNARAAATGLLEPVRRVARFFVDQAFSSLTRRIVILNLAGLIVLVTGIMYLSQFRAGLIDARIQSLLVQGEIIAGAVAASASVDTGAVSIDPERLLELQTGESSPLTEDPASVLEFPINPERVAPVLKRLVTPTRTRARIYDREGSLLLDSRTLYGRGDVIRFDLPPPAAHKPGVFDRIYIALKQWSGRGDLPLYRELGLDGGRGYPEVAQALAGQKASAVRITERGEVIVSVAVPIQRFRAITGSLLLSTQSGEIDAMVEAERIAIAKVFVVAAAVMVILSVLLAGTIAGPVRKLAEAAEGVQKRIRARVEIPDFTDRKDEIGHLSGAIRDMTGSLYQRIEAIERFAADVAHELKNPLTSLRSAVETLPLARTEQSRERLLEVIQHDVKRLDRLISDISDASRLDAELQRQEVNDVDLPKLLRAVTTVANEVRRDDNVKVLLNFEGIAPFVVPGHDSRLGQVVVNLIDNARSFSPKGGTVRVICRKLKGFVDIVVEDEGPGIRPDALEKIFERFYTDRPHQGFGQNSGLGLSISRQIVEAHRGRIWAENRLGKPGADGERPVIGASFTVRLPNG
jgi:two-component system sensor histidine kinase ChvG